MEHMNIRDNRTPRRFFVDNTIIYDYGPVIGPYGIAVYCALCVHADKDTQNCYPSHRLLAKEIGCSERKVRDVLKQLKDLGLIAVHHRKRKDNNGQTTNDYFLLDPPARDATPPGTGDTPPQYRDVPTNNPNIEQSPSNSLSANADVETPSALDTGPKEVDIPPGSKTLKCPNPECGQEIRIGAIKESATACPVCGQPILVLVDGEPYGKPPKAKKSKGDKRILGNLLEDCPTPLVLVPYFAREREEVLAAWRGKSKAIFLEALEWARKAYLRDGLPHHLVTRSALGFYRKKASAASGVVHDDDDDEGSWFVEGFFDTPEGSVDATQETDEGRVGVLVR
jgi:hypothetical protein